MYAEYNGYVHYQFFTTFLNIVMSGLEFQRVIFEERVKS